MNACELSGLKLYDETENDISGTMHDDTILDSVCLCVVNSAEYRPQAWGQAETGYLYYVHTHACMC